MKTYTVQPGDTLWKISRRYQLELDDLIAANPQLEDPNQISIGQLINIPELWQTPVLPEPDEPGQITRPSERPCIYSAQAGETLESISHSFRIPMTRMLYFNLRYARQEQLPAGAKVILPEPEIQPINPPASAGPGLIRRPR